MALENENRNKPSSADATAAASSSNVDNTTSPTSTTTTMTTKKERKRKRRWGDAVAKPSTTASTTTTTATAATAATTSSTTAAGPNRVLALQESIKARLAAAKAKQQQQGVAVVPSSTTAAAPTTTTTTSEQERPVKRAKHYELDLSVTGPTFQASTTAAAAAAKPAKKVNPYLAHLSKEDDDNQQQSAAAASSANQKQDEADAATLTMIRASKPRPRHKEIHFVEPGHWQEVAEKKREKAAQAAAAGYVSGRKAGHTIQAAGLGDRGGSSSTIYGRSASDYMDDDDDSLAVLLPPRADAHPDTKMPLCMEWWDMELLPSKIKKQVALTESQALSKQSKAALQQLDDGSSYSRTKSLSKESADNKTITTDDATKSDGNSNKKDDNNNDDDDDDNTIKDLRHRCFDQASLRYSKTAALVQHIVPIRPANADTGPPKQPVLHLTKKELKRQRKLRRQEKQRELQDLQAAGLIPAPEPRLTLRNFIQVLGDQAFVDPSQMEQKVMEQVQARQRAHLERNEANKLTKEQRAAKRERKIQEDTTTGVTVAVFYVKDMSHPYHRAKIDLNAQQYKISGGVLECQNPPLACVICEGGPKAIKKYIRLMLVRMKWTGPDDDVQDLEDDDDDVGVQGEEDGEYKTQKFNPDNKCDLVWQGMAVKPLFKGFFFQSCETSDQARKVLKNKGVAHYWDQVLRHASGRDSGLQLKLTMNEDGNDSDNPYKVQKDEDEDIIMKE